MSKPPPDTILITVELDGVFVKGALSAKLLRQMVFPESAVEYVVRRMLLDLGVIEP